MMQQRSEITTNAAGTGQPTVQAKPVPDAPGSGRARPVIVALLLLGVAVAGLFLFAPREDAKATGVAPTADISNESSPVEPARALAATPAFSDAPPALVSPQAKWGIEIIGLRLGAGGKTLDIRYKVLDVAKASTMVNLAGETFVQDLASGQYLEVPFQRESQTTQKLVEGKTFFALVPNKGNLIKPGSKVTVALGGAKVENLTVE